MARYSLEKCLCQFGYDQSIHRPIHIVSFEGIDRWFMSNFVSNVDAIKANAVDVQFLGQCQDGYLEWYFTISPFLIIPHVQPADDTEPSMMEDL